MKPSIFFLLQILQIGFREHTHCVSTACGFCPACSSTASLWHQLLLIIGGLVTFCHDPLEIRFYRICVL